ncbi:MAG: hotdog fold domain-containing protein [Candidatus Eisenbacteria bacterium]
MSEAKGPGARLLANWRNARRLPFGDALFTMALGRMVPYTATIAPRVLELQPGLARVAMSDRHGVRNHLDSVHAIALANLGEFTSGVAMITALPPDVRSIVTGLSIEYLKKARGTLVAEARVSVPPVTGDVEHLVHAEIRDTAQDVVARIEVRWRLSPREA